MLSYFFFLELCLLSVPLLLLFHLFPIPEVLWDVIFFLSDKNSL